MASEISTATVELSTTAEQISTDIVAIEHVSEETVKAAAAIAAESDALSALSVELKDEISRFTHNGQRAPVAIKGEVVGRGGVRRLAWLKPNEAFAA